MPKRYVFGKSIWLLVIKNGKIFILWVIMTNYDWIWPKLFFKSKPTSDKFFFSKFLIVSSIFFQLNNKNLTCENLFFKIFESIIEIPSMIIRLHNEFQNIYTYVFFNGPPKNLRIL